MPFFRRLRKIWQTVPVPAPVGRKPENAEELAEQMERLIQDPKLAEKLGENAMNSVREKWNEKRMAQDIWEFCREIVG